MSSRLFVTGAMRSGTTLLDKLLSAHPQISIYSQPLPLLYSEVKKSFLGSRYANSQLGPVLERYPLIDLFAEHYTPPSEFVTFLAGFKLQPGQLRRVLEEMRTYSGQKTRPRQHFSLPEASRSIGLLEFVEAYLRALDPEAGEKVIGSKETFCEEYIPFFLAGGVKVVQTVRDPRAVLASLNYGAGRKYSGRRRPDLFNLRQWRKSVAFALAHRGHPGFLALRYEDLVRDPDRTLERVSSFLDVDSFPPGAHRRLRTYDGKVWRSNSSHAAPEELFTESIERYRELLEPKTDLFVQAVCFWEMRRLGYEVDLKEQAVQSVLDEHRSEEPLERRELAYYHWCPERVAEERERFRHLQDNSFEAPLFLFHDAFVELRNRDLVGLET